MKGIVIAGNHKRVGRARSRPPNLAVIGRGILYDNVF